MRCSATADSAEASASGARRSASRSVAVRPARGPHQPVVARLAAMAAASAARRSTAASAVSPLQAGQGGPEQKRHLAVGVQVGQVGQSHVPSQPKPQPELHGQWPRHR